MTTYKDILVLVDKVTAPLRKINDSMKKTSANGEKLKDKFERLRLKMEKMRPAMRNVWTGIKRITGVFIGLVGAGGILTAGIAKMTEFADNIDKMSQKIGMSIEDYQKWNYIMSINGGSVDTLKMGFKTLTTQIEGVQKGSKDSIKAFQSLGVKVKDNTGKFRKQNDIFFDSIKALQRIENQTQRDILANRLFGRSAAELRPLLNMSADAMEDLAKNFEKYNMALTDEEVKRATKFKDSWTTFTMFLQSSTMKALSDLYPKLQQILDAIMRHKQEILAVIKAIGWLAYQLIKLIAVVGGVAKAFADGFKSIIDRLKTANEWAQGFLDKLGKIAYFIPFVNVPLIGQAMQDQYYKNLSNSSKGNNTTNNTTNNFYNQRTYNNNVSYNNAMPLSNGGYILGGT